MSVRGWVAFACALLAGCGSSGSHGAGDGATASPSPLPSPSAAATAFVSTAPPIDFHGSRIGSRYVYATKRKGTKQVYVLRADTVNAVYNGTATGRSAFTNPHVVFYGDAGKRLHADAPAGTVEEKDKTVVMTGGVRARTDDGMTLRSDVLRYDDETQIVHGTGHVVVTFPQGEELQGETVDWNLRDGHINVTGAR
jgi:LPS export ABC transporter protein LptC